MTSRLSEYVTLSPSPIRQRPSRLSKNYCTTKSIVRGFSLIMYILNLLGRRYPPEAHRTLSRLGVVEYKESTKKILVGCMAKTGTGIVPRSAAQISTEKRSASWGLVVWVALWHATARDLE